MNDDLRSFLLWSQKSHFLLLLLLSAYMIGGFVYYIIAKYRNNFEPDINLHISITYKVSDILFILLFFQLIFKI